MSPLDSLEVFYGECSPASARVYARLPGHAHDDGWTLSGTVRGPECALAQTLPSTVRLVDMGPGERLLAGAVVPDPCCWSPDLPALYRVSVELHRHGEDVASAQRELGIRAFGARGRSLYLDGRRWVLRGVCRRAVPPVELPEWREAGAVMVVSDSVAGQSSETTPGNGCLDDALCEAASHRGVMLAVRLAGDTATCASRLAHLSRWAAVAVAIVESGDVDGAALRRAAPNLLLAAYVPLGQEIPHSSWAEAVVCEAADPATLRRQVAGCNRPVIAARWLEGIRPLPEARRECDLLQRDLAPPADFAGYIV